MNIERLSFCIQAIMLLNIKQEIVLQYQRNSCQLHSINALSFKNAVNGASFQVNLPRKLRHCHPAFVEDGFDALPDMDVLLRGHVLGFWT